MERPKEFASGKALLATIGGCEFTANLAVAVSDALIKKKIDSACAQDVAMDVMEQLRHFYGGQTVYFRRGVRPNLMDRDFEIYERHASNELSVQDITREYGISLQWVYHILRTVPVKLRKAREKQRRSRVKGKG